ncbi:MAG: MaoC/PaaZ C-terminal domain-containing protein [Solirubrobacterales bacterium]
MSALAPDTGLHYEEMAVGREFETAAHTVSAAEVAEFARLTGDDNPLHVDPAAARRAGFPGVLAHGPLVQALTIGLIAHTGIMRGTTVALLEVASTFHAPVFPGDTIRGVVRISRKRPTRSPDRGLLWRRVEILNQDDTVVARLRMVALIRRLGADASDGNSSPASPASKGAA